MRYTTVIDISEFDNVYRNRHAVLIYLHLALKAGWHDHDRDLVEMSLRKIMLETGISLSAVRHAVRILEAANLIKRQGTLWYVRKWEMSQEPTPRPKNARQKRQIDIAAERQAQNERREMEAEIEHARREKQFAEGKNPYMIWYEQQMKKAAAGDIEAQKSVERNRKTYEQHVQSMKQKQ